MKRAKELEYQLWNATMIMRTSFIECRAAQFLFEDDSCRNLPIAYDAWRAHILFPIFEIENGIKADSINRVCDETYRRTKYSY